MKRLIEFIPEEEAKAEAEIGAMLIHEAIATIDNTIIIDLLVLQLWNIFRQTASEVQLRRPQLLNEGLCIIVRLIFLLCNVQKIPLLCAKPACPTMICLLPLEVTIILSVMVATITTTTIIIITINRLPVPVVEENPLLLLFLQRQKEGHQLQTISGHRT